MDFFIGTSLTGSCSFHDPCWKSERPKRHTEAEREREKTRILLKSLIRGSNGSETIFSGSSKLFDERIKRNGEGVREKEKESW